jgi:hypothetical protein
MQRRTRIALTALGALLVLVAACSLATARRIEISDQTFLARWNATAPNTYLTFRGGFGISIECRATIKGSFHSRTISKVCGQLIGYVYRDPETTVIHPCPNNDINGEYFFLNGTEVLATRTVPNTLPWHIRYLSFAGTLPAITGIKIAIIGFAILASGAGFRCLYQSTEVLPFVGTMQIAANGDVTGFRVNEEESLIPLVSGEGLACSRTVTASGLAAWRNAAKSTTLVKVRLVQ